MQSRLEYAKATRGAVKAMRGLESYVYKRGDERLLLELVKTRHPESKAARIA